MLFKISLIFLYILLFIFILNRKKEIVLYTFLFVLNLFVMLSLVLIEEGFFISEQQVFGYENGSFYIYIVYSILSLLLFRLFVIGSSGLNKYHINRKIDYFIPIAIVFSLVLIYSFIVNPNYTRFDIFNGPYNMMFVRIEGLFYFAYIYSILRTTDVKKRFFILLIFSILMFFRGSQFGAFMIAGIWYFISFVLDDKPFDRRIMLYLFFIAMIPIAIKISLHDLSFIYKRIILEGHVFWGTINLFFDNGVNNDFTEFFNNYNDISSQFQQGNLEFGLGKLMDEISPGIAEMYLEAGVRFAAGYPAILIYHFGILIGSFLHIVVLYIYFLIIRYLVYSCRFYGIILSYLFFIIFTVYNDFIVQGEYMNFRLKFLIKILIFMLAFTMLKIFRNTQDKNNFKNYSY